MKSSDQSTMVKALRAAAGKIPAIPLTFLGLGVYRAWIEVAFVGSWVDFPVEQFSSRNLFDLAMVLTLFGCVFAARRVGPFCNKPALYVVCGGLLTFSTALVFCSDIWPQAAPAFALLSTLSGGIGIALLILFWSELYGCLNPLRVALYYSASIVLGAVILYVYRGFYFPWLFAMTVILPALSLVMAATGFHSLPEKVRPSQTWQKFSVPWRIIVLMAVYAFAYGLLEKPLYAGVFGPHSALGTVVVGALTFLCVLVQGKRFDFNQIYRLALPLMVAAFLLISSVGLGTEASNFCISAGYTALSILTMIIMANICYRYGVSAVWLFGIERGVRAVAMYLGRKLPVALGLFMSPETVAVAVSAVSIVAVVVATMMLMSQKELENRWGASFLGGEQESPAMVERQRVADECSRIARECKLSMREEEVLLLLANRKTISEVERELFIANGTAKAHVRHIYQKLDIHSRDELFEMLAIAPESPESAAGE